MVSSYGKRENKQERIVVKIRERYIGDDKMERVGGIWTRS